MKSEIITALFTLAGTIVGATGSFLITYLNRRFDDRRHLREIAIKTAVQYWEADIELAKLRGELTHSNVRVAPLDSYIVHMLLLAELVSDKRITGENVTAELRRIRSISHAAAESEKEPHSDA
ncbi:MAG: hypothetical protein ACLQU3_33815 [Limisphaerales bacterium]